MADSEADSEAQADRRALRALCDLLMDAVLPGEEAIAPPAQQIDWLRVIALAHRHRTLPVLANSHLVSDPATPAAVKQMLGDFAAQTRSLSEEALVQIAEVVGRLNRIGVVPMLFKGAAHAVTGLYPHVAMRYLADVDIVVPADRIEACVSALEGEGYVACGEWPGVQWHHVPGLARPDRPLIVELHRWAMAAPHSRFLPAEELLASGVAIEVAGARALVPSHFHAALIAIAHSELVDRNYLLARFDLRRLIDVALLQRSEPDAALPERLAKRFRDYGAPTAFAYNQRWLGFVDRRTAASGASGVLAGILFRNAQFLDRHPKTLSVVVRLVRPWIALRRDLSDPSLRRELARNLVKPHWWRKQIGLFSEKR